MVKSWVLILQAGPRVGVVGLGIASYDKMALVILRVRPSELNLACAFV